MSEVATWSWRARDAGGNLLSGVLTAPSAQEVASRLRSEGKVVIGVSRGGAGESTPVATSRPDGRVVPKAELLQFARQVSVMLEAGVSITEALEAFVRQSPGMRVTPEIAEPVHELLLRTDPLQPCKISSCSGTMISNDRFFIFFYFHLHRIIKSSLFFSLVLGTELV